MPGSDRHNLRYVALGDSRTEGLAVGEYHRKVGRDPAGVVAGAAGPHPAQGTGEGTGQSGGIGEIGQQVGPGG